MGGWMCRPARGNDAVDTAPDVVAVSESAGKGDPAPPAENDANAEIAGEVSENVDVKARNQKKKGQAEKVVQSEKAEHRRVEGLQSKSSDKQLEVQLFGTEQPTRKYPCIISVE
eukprot:1391549-Amorphochlora_amoeboformis.AAC.1